VIPCQVVFANDVACIGVKACVRIPANRKLWELVGWVSDDMATFNNCSTFCYADEEVPNGPVRLLAGPLRLVNSSCAANTKVSIPVVAPIFCTDF
jgi:hypothetical protein